MIRIGHWDDPDSSDDFRQKSAYPLLGDYLRMVQFASSLSLPFLTSSTRPVLDDMYDMSVRQDGFAKVALRATIPPPSCPNVALE